ncbi:MAG: hypothetical protein HFH69_00780 [Lachnospiraceae bacterium]|nr:hypothetical protein [Lachnospiraceae bacterium]
MKKDTHIIIGFCLLFFILAGFLFVKQQRESAGFAEESFFAQGEVASSALPGTAGQKDGQGRKKEAQKDRLAEEKQECAVYISGAVKHPRLYRYHGVARLCDAVESAGGFLKNADRASVNLARLLEDGEQIHVLTKKQAKKQASASGKEAAGNAAGGMAGLVNINKASLEELMSLPGIGQAKAQLILDYRTEHGVFAAKEDLMKISGIKDGIYKKIKDLITIT